jgi:hypothetical protein
VWCGVPSKRILKPFFSEATVTGTFYLTVLDGIILCCKILFPDEDCYFQHIGSPLQYHSDVRNILDARFHHEHG